MSVLVDISKLPPTTADFLTKELTVRSTPPTQPPGPPQRRRPAMFTPQTVIESFHVTDFRSKDGAKRVAAVPFSFFYHYSEDKSLKRVPLPIHAQKKIPFKGELLPRQQAIRKQSLEILQRTGSILLCLHTGFGKTIFTLFLLSKIGLRALVLCHRSVIIQQWIESVQRYLPELTVAVLEPSALDKSVNADIVIANPINVPKVDAVWFEPFGLVVIDEVHTICTSQFSKALFQFTPSYLIGLSATPYREDGMDRLLELYLGPEMIYRGMKRFFNAYRLPTNVVLRVEKTADDRVNWNALLSQQSVSDERNRLICKLSWYFGQRNILILVKLKEHALKLQHLLQQLGEDVDCFIDTDKHCNYSCRVLIATYSKGGVGFDHPKLDMLIAGADVEANFMQYLGRVFRRDDVTPIYVDLRDELQMMVKHSQSRLAIVKDVGGSVKDFYHTFKGFEEITGWLDTHPFATEAPPKRKRVKKTTKD